jgi:hypothetical protein
MPATVLASRQVPAGGGGGNAVTRGTFVGSRPASPSAGDQYLCTDAPFTEVYTGSAWEVRYDGIVVKPPPTSGWTWANQGTAAVATAGGLVTLSDAGHLGAANRWYYRSAPAAPFTITFGLCALGLTSYFNAGVAFRSSGGKYVLAYAGGSGSSFYGGQWAVNKYDNSTDYNSNYRAKNGFCPAMNRFWMRLVDDNTNREIWASYDRRTWTRLHQVGRTDFLTANGVSLYLNTRDDEGSGAEVGGSVSLFDYEDA